MRSPAGWTFVSKIHTRLLYPYWIRAN